MIFSVRCPVSPHGGMSDSILPFLHAVIFFMMVILYIALCPIIYQVSPSLPCPCYLPKYCVLITVSCQRENLITSQFVQIVVAVIWSGHWEFPFSLALLTYVLIVQRWLKILFVTISSVSEVLLVDYWGLPLYLIYLSAYWEYLQSDWDISRQISQIISFINLLYIFSCLSLVRPIHFLYSYPYHLNLIL